CAPVVQVAPSDWLPRVQGRLHSWPLLPLRLVDVHDQPAVVRSTKTVLRARFRDLSGAETSVQASIPVAGNERGLHQQQESYQARHNQSRLWYRLARSIPVFFPATA